MKRNIKLLATLISSAFSLTMTQAAFGQDSAKPADGEAKPAAQNAAPADKPAPPAEGQPAKPAGQRHPKEAVDHYNRGVELHKGGFLNKAIMEYKEAIVLDDQMEPAYSNLGLIYTAQKSWNKALEAFDKALSMKPNRTTSLNGLGTVLYAMKRNDEAMEKWKKAVEIDPGFASAYYNMGNAYEGQEKHREALENYVKATDVNPKMADAYYRIGSLMNKTKHLPQAQVLLEKAVKLAPEAEFARDARRQIEGIEKQFVKDGSESATTYHTEQHQTAEPKKQVATGATKTTPTVEKKGGIRKPSIKGLFKRPGQSGDKDKANKNVDMFVQPPSAEGDLKAKPGDEG